MLFIALFLFQIFQTLFEIPENENNKVIAFSSVFPNEREKISIFLFDKNKNVLSFVDSNREVVVAESVSFHDWSWAYGKNGEIYILYRVVQPSPAGRYKEVYLLDKNIFNRGEIKADYVRNIKNTHYERFYWVFHTWYQLLIVRDTDSLKIKGIFGSPQRGFKEKGLYIFLDYYQDLNENIYCLRSYFISDRDSLIYDKKIKFAEEILDAGVYNMNLIVLLKGQPNKLKLKFVDENSMIEFGEDDDYGEFEIEDSSLFLIVRNYDNNKTKIYKIEIYQKNIIFVGEIDGTWYYGGVTSKGLIVWSEKRVALVKLPSTKVENNGSEGSEGNKNIVYPTVVRDYLNINENVEIEIYNLIGQKINLRRAGSLVDCRTLPSGMYFIVLKNDKKVLKYIKFIKIK